MATRSDATGDLQPGPTVAVVTVCLNDLRGLQSTYDSLRAQTVPPRQWIVADGASTDGTQDWLRTVDWSPLTWSSQADGGIYEGMNHGLRLVGTDYVLFLNSGDVLASPADLEAVDRAIAHTAPKPSLLYGDCLEVDASGVSSLKRARGPYWVPIGMPTSHQAMFFRVDSIPGGFDLRYRLSSDYAAVASLFTSDKGADFLHLPRPLCRFGLGGRSHKHRISALREDFAIRRRVVGMSAPAAILLYVLHYLHWLIKQYVPVLHRLARYS